MFTPRVRVLEKPQRSIWNRLGEIPTDFVLYGGTAVALRLGHRKSVDFDFFSSRDLDRSRLEALSLLRTATVLSETPNTWLLIADQVKLSFFGGLSIGRLAEPDFLKSPGIMIASIADLLATKLKVIQQRAEKKDYLDIHAILKDGLNLPLGLAGMTALYPKSNPASALKALTYFEDGDLDDLPVAVKRYLSRAASSVAELPEVRRLSDSISTEKGIGSE